MIRNLGALVNEFSSFLTEHSNMIGKQEFSEHLVSYKLLNSDLQLLNKLTAILRNYPRAFYLENVNEKFSLLGLGSALELSENGLGRFSTLGKSYRELKGKIISNWREEKNEFPLICGGMKFTVEHSDDEWKDFKDSDWFVPEFLLVEKNGSRNLFYNFNNQNVSLKKQTDKFASKLESLLNIQANAEVKTPNILSSKGISPKDKKKWKALILNTLDKMLEQSISKIVVSRRVDLVLSGELNWDDVTKYFNEHYPDCYVFIYHNNYSTFFGATPERLIKIQDKKITIDALAGSISRGINEEEDKKFEREMLTSSKLNHEHDLVVHQLKKAISKYVSKITAHKIPFKKLLNIQHLHTLLESELIPDTSIFELIEAIYPTGAICGEPKDKALSLLKKIEDHKRGLYSGIIGYLNLADEGEFFIGIRSALQRENKLFAYAGGGIVEGSNPELEFEETELKLRAILNFFDEKNKN